MMPKAISFQLCYLLNSLSPRLFPLELTCSVPCVINVEEHSGDKLKLDLLPNYELLLTLHFQQIQKKKERKKSAIWSKTRGV